MANEQITIPDMGGADEAEIIEILVAVGDQVSLEQSLVVLESDKASMEIPSPKEGTVTKLLVANGDNVKTGTPILEIELASDSSATDSNDDTDSTNSSSVAEAAPAEQEEIEVQPTQNEDIPESATSVSLIELPDIGDDTAEVIELSVTVGDSLNVDDTIAVLESDKASMEVPCSKQGIVLAIHIKEGDELRTGAPLLDLEVSESVSTESAAPAENAQKTAAEIAPSAPEKSVEPIVAATTANTDSVQLEPSGNVYAGPAVRKLAREFGVNLSLVSGSGPKGRVLKEDVQNFVKRGLSRSGATSSASGSAIPVVPEIDFSAFGEIEAVPMTRLHKLTAANMSRSWLNVPHVTQHDDADITELEEFRASLKPEMQRRDLKLSPLPFLVKACAVALMRHPKFRSSLHSDGETIVFKQYCHIGMAVDTDAGLVVPVIRDADKKSVWDIGEEILDLAARAKDRKLKIEEMQGGCFTVSSLGNIGGLGFSPIVNTPEVGILGVSRMTVKPVFDGADFQPRKMLPLSLSYDHRAINGGDAGRFLTELCQLLSDIRLQLM
ncbi:MAG: dihydrolipoyllysine-residue acetyltransferase [Pseudomonadales bacterium]